MFDVERAFVPFLQLPTLLQCYSACRKISRRITKNDCPWSWRIHSCVMTKCGQRMIWAWAAIFRYVTSSYQVLMGSRIISLHFKTWIFSSTINPCIRCLKFFFFLFFVFSMIVVLKWFSPCPVQKFRQSIIWMRKFFPIELFVWREFCF